MPTFVLETEWSWDRLHREFCSFTVEDHDANESPAKMFENDAPEDLHKSWQHVFQQICSAQNGSLMGQCKPVRLWVVWQKVDHPSVEDPETEINFYLALKLVGEFDWKGRPKVKETEKQSI